MTNKHTPSNRERRSITHKIELRRAADGSRTIVGYASVFAPAQSEDLGGFREQIDRHAFDAHLATNPDVRCLWNHDPNHVLGRTTAGTLKLSTDSKGLRYECKLPDTQAAQDLATSMERGDIDQSSFGFTCSQDNWQQTPEGEALRTVLAAQLFDVSPVTFPAYTDATAGIRAAIRSMPADLRSKLKQRRSDAKTKKVDGVELRPSSFAYVGDPDKPETWKLPVYFSGDEKKTVDHIKDALARFNQTEGIPNSEKAHVYAKIVGAAKAVGIHVTAEKLEDRDWDDDGYDDDDDEDDIDIGTDTNDDDCECDCAPCSDGDCEDCAAPDCDDVRCLGCPNALRRRHLDLLIRRLRA
jgi:uncharacterized protein